MRILITVAAVGALSLALAGCHRHWGRDRHVDARPAPQARVAARALVTPKLVEREG